MSIPLRQIMALLGHYLRDQQWRMVGLTLLAFMGIGLQLLPPQIIRRFIDGITPQQSLEQLMRWALPFIGLLCCPCLYSPTTRAHF